MIFAAVENPYPWFVFDLPFWSGIVFIMLVAALSFTLFPSLGRAMAERERGVVNALKQAEVARAEVAQLRVQQEAERRRLRQLAADLVVEAKRDAERVKRDAVTRAQTEIAGMKLHQQRELERRCRQIQFELWTITAELCSGLAQKSLVRGLTRADHDRLIDEAIAAVGAAKGANG